MGQLPSRPLGPGRARPTHCPRPTPRSTPDSRTAARSRLVRAPPPLVYPSSVLLPPRPPASRPPACDVRTHTIHALSADPAAQPRAQPTLTLPAAAPSTALPAGRALHTAAPRSCLPFIVRCVLRPCVLPCPVPVRVRVPRPHPRSRRLRDLHRAHGPRGTPSRRLGPASRPCPIPGSHSETDATSIAPSLSCGHCSHRGPRPSRRIISDSDRLGLGLRAGSARRTGTSSQLGHSDSPYCIRTRVIPPTTVHRAPCAAPRDMHPAAKLRVKAPDQYCSCRIAPAVALSLSLSSKGAPRRTPHAARGALVQY